MSLALRENTFYPFQKWIFYCFKAHSHLLEIWENALYFPMLPHSVAFENDEGWGKKVSKDKNCALAGREYFKTIGDAFKTTCIFKHANLGCFFTSLCSMVATKWNQCCSGLPCGKSKHQSNFPCSKSMAKYRSLSPISAGKAHGSDTF